MTRQSKPGMWVKFVYNKGFSYTGHASIWHPSDGLHQITVVTSNDLLDDECALKLPATTLILQ